MGMWAKIRGLSMKKADKGRKENNYIRQTPYKIKSCGTDFKVAKIKLMKC